MNFSTVIPIAKSKQNINYNSKIVLLGSCFSENIGDKFSYFKFQNTVNPFGIIFNPVSIKNLLARIINDKKFTEDDVLFHNERWHCFEVHSDLSRSNKEKFLHDLNAILKDTHLQLINSNHIIITYGTSWVYRKKDSNMVVANCHKVSQNHFDKEILSIEAIENAVQSSIDLIQKINPKCQIIFTISPVRHIKDGFVENQLSKAHLIAAIYKIVKTTSSSIHYFPSYEIMMDELRDYRFYDLDMLHPSQVAIDYIWEKFTNTYILSETFSVMDEVRTIQKALKHRPFNPNSDQHLQFLENVNKNIEALQGKFVFMEF